MIDTLKLSKRLQEAAMPKEQAEALAEGLRDAINEELVTKQDLQAAVALLEVKITEKISQVLYWIIGSIVLQIVGHFWH
jgi:hypothetical protein